VSQSKSGRALSDEVRLEELESRVAFQDDVVENLNRVVARQDREIQQLQQEIAELKARFHELDDTSPPSTTPGFEVPPHY